MSQRLSYQIPNYLRTFARPPSRTRPPQGVHSPVLYGQQPPSTAMFPAFSAAVSAEPAGVEVAQNRNARIVGALETRRARAVVGGAGQNRAVLAELVATPGVALAVEVAAVARLCHQLQMKPSLVAEEAAVADSGHWPGRGFVIEVATEMDVPAGQ